eukprot:205153-Hanusia_phi.AAC.1
MPANTPFQTPTGKEGKVVQGIRCCTKTMDLGVGVSVRGTQSICPKLLEKRKDNYYEIYGY